MKNIFEGKTGWVISIGLTAAFIGALDQAAGFYPGIRSQFFDAGTGYNQRGVDRVVLKHPGQRICAGIEVDKDTEKTSCQTVYDIGRVTDKTVHLTSYTLSRAAPQGTLMVVEMDLVRKGGDLCMPIDDNVRHLTNYQTRKDNKATIRGNDKWDDDMQEYFKAESITKMGKKGMSGATYCIAFSGSLPWKNGDFYMKETLDSKVVSGGFAKVIKDERSQDVFLIPVVK